MTSGHLETRVSDRKRARRQKPSEAAELAHKCVGRTRLVLRDRKGERAFFEQLCDDVLALPGVTEVEGRTLTGSLIITHPDMGGADVIAAARKRQKAVHVWTVNRPDRMSYFINLGVDNIITDYPTKLATVIKERAALTDVEKFLLVVADMLKR